jgi:hypothetical protein
MHVRAEASNTEFEEKCDVCSDLGRAEYRGRTRWKPESDWVPYIVGTFSTMTACQDAASGAQIVKAGRLPQSLFTGSVFVCAQKE